MRIAIFFSCNIVTNSETHMLRKLQKHHGSVEAPATSLSGELGLPQKWNLGDKKTAHSKNETT